MDIVLIRHGEPARSLMGAAAADPWLSDQGREQAEVTGLALADEEFDALYTSPLQRARETAETLSTHVGLAARVDENLAEFDQGSAYLHFEDAGSESGSPYELYLRNDLSPWGTTAAAFQGRVMRAFGAIIDAHQGQRVLVVSHGGVQNAFLGSLLGIASIHFHDPAYLSISRVRAGRSGARSVVSLNETDHLNHLRCPDPTMHAKAQRLVAGPLK